VAGLTPASASARSPARLSDHWLFNRSVAAAALAPAQAFYGTIQITASGITTPAGIRSVLNVSPTSSLPSPDPEPAGLVFHSVFGRAPARPDRHRFRQFGQPVTYSAAANTTAAAPG